MENQTAEGRFTRQAIEISIKIGAIFLILSWCYKILEPFIVPVVWAGIIAVAIGPVCDWIQPRVGGNRKLAAALVTLFMLATLITPTTILASRAFDSIQDVHSKFERDEFHIEPPAEKVKEWIFIGDDVYRIWNEAASNLDRTVKKYEPQIEEQVKKIVKQAAGFGGAILMFVLSVIISGFFMAGARSGKDTLVLFARRLAGDAGEHFVNLSGVTIRNVTRGILGVAFIQAVLAAIGLYVMEVPGAPLLAFGVLVLGVVQISPGLILIPVSIYTFSVASPTIATIFLIWNLIVGMLDNVLKPLLMGQGSSVPTLVIFLGAIGGFLASGLVGLFVGAVIVVLGYELFQSWLHANDDEEPADSKETSV